MIGKNLYISFLRHPLRFLGWGGIVGLFYVSFTLLSPYSFAKRGPVTGFPLPRFVSMKDSVANIRTGPGKRYPVSVVLKTKMPVLIIDEYSHWRRIRDFQGEEGWVHKALLSHKRLVMISAPITNLHKTDSETSGIRAKIKQNVVLYLESCKSQWCYVRVPAIAKSGYVKRAHLFGIFPKEIYNP